MAQHRAYRPRVVGIFPDKKSLIRPMGAVLVEQKDEWAVSRRYMSRHSLGRSYQSSTPEIGEEVTRTVAIPIQQGSVLTCVQKLSEEGTKKAGDNRPTSISR